MSIVCDSPKFEVSNDQASYFNIHLPGSYMSTPTTEKSSTAGYFDINPRSFPTQTPYFDTTKSQSPTQTPYFDCEPFPTPFFEQLQHGLRHNNNPNVDNNKSCAMDIDGANGFPLMTPSIMQQNSFQDGMTPPLWANNVPFSPKLPTMPVQRRQSMKPSSTSGISSNRKPHSMPTGLTSLTPITTSFVEYSMEAVAVMINQIQSDPVEKNILLLLDLRPFSSYAAERIKTSVNICVPNTLLKRCSFSVDKITDTLVSDADKNAFKSWAEYKNIVLYDNESTSLLDSNPIFHLCKKFRSPNSRTRIGFLKGGFSAFSTKYEDLCEKTLVNQPTSSIFPRRRSSSLSRKPGPFTCPTPIMETAGVNPFFSNIRQNIELSNGITETIPVRIPQDISIDQSRLPDFMREIVYGSNGEMRLAETFHEIERAEQRRLQSLMLHNSNKATLDCPFSISAGMEKGTKNRYNNIWPYDHARVKINECKEGDCDYVNASFVQANGCDKRYIATQGPMPATYEDFWKVVWEQNSRLIVMLTKEQEAGRIQCHRYWTECIGTPCNFGAIELILISESSSTHDGNSSLENVIITRKFRLSYKNHPAREITQLHFLGWPDFGVPESPRHILNLIDIANSVQLNAQQNDPSHAVGPMVVHCSAGCGRTGAFCTIDSVISMFNNISKTDSTQDIIRNTVAQFREQRLSMVQTLRQFVFCYEAILWKLLDVA